MTQAQFGELRSARERRGICAQSPVVAPEAKTRSLVRQTAKFPNQAEFAFQGEVLYFQKLRAEIKRYEFEPLRLRLANGVTYTPDFCVWLHTGALTFYEVKGEKRKGRVIVRDDAAIKIKLAAAHYPEWRFVLVWKDKGGFWQEQVVLP